MKAIRIIIGLLSIFVSLPIWYYLLYKVLQGVHASELMWFLYWIYLPIGILASVIEKLVKVATEE